MAFQKIKGTLDYIGIDAKKRRYVEQMIRDVMTAYNLQEIITPTFEQTEVFSRSSGETSDVVTKEMYTFKDKKDRSITLRPEGTAAVVRAFIENKLYALPGIKKYFYNMPMYRYERPQKGRYREFVQFGVEYFGDASYLLDADVIGLGDAIFKKLGLNNYYVSVNTIGDFESRMNYQNALRTYFKEHIDCLCEDCKNRLEKNPMRILDCKVDKDSEILKNAPVITDYLTSASKEYFNNLLNALDQMGIKYVVDEKLVRGLDYYTDTVFEYISTGDDTNNPENLKGLAIGAGGRYTGLTKTLGGPDVPGIGFAFGVDRVASLLEYYHLLPLLSSDVDLCVLTLDDQSKVYALSLITKLRMQGITCEIDYINNNLKPQFKLSERLNAKYVGIIGEDERQKELINIKDTKTGNQEPVKISELIDYLKK